MPVVGGPVDKFIVAVKSGYCTDLSSMILQGRPTAERLPIGYSSSVFGERGRHAQNSRGHECVPVEGKMPPNAASHSRIAFSSIASNTGSNRRARR